MSTNGTGFQRWLVQQTGISVADQKAMDNQTWMRTFGKLAAEFKAPPAPSAYEPNRGRQQQVFGCIYHQGEIVHAKDVRIHEILTQDPQFGTVSLEPADADCSQAASYWLIGVSPEFAAHCEDYGATIELGGGYALLIESD